ncbi:MAG: hypothetical protein ACRDNF_07775 [Streptosporangiaceae bacterium]
MLADDTGHRALPAWVAEEPGGVSLPDLLDRPADDIWTTASIPWELAVRLAGAVGGNVTGVEIYPVTAEPDEVNTGTCAARIELGARHVTARLDQGLTLAVVAGAPVRVDAAVMDRLAVPVPADDPAAPFRSSPDGRGHVIIARREGRVLPGARPRFEPRNTTFADGLDRWQLDGSDDYSAAAEGSTAIVSSAVAKPSGSAVLMQTVFADDFYGAPVVFRGEFRTENVAGQAGLCLRILAKGWKDPGRVEEHVVVAGSRDWSREEISAWVPEGTDIVQFGIILTGSGRAWLRNPDLRRGDA